MRTLKTYAAHTLLLLALAIGFLACEKDFIDEPGGLRTPETLAPPAVVFSTTNSGPKSMTAERTVLGAPRRNPYTVANMTAALNEVYSLHVDRVPTTHLYLKFEPRDEADLAMLEKHDFDLFDFPLERELVEMGDYYFVPEHDEDYPTLWAVVAPDTDLPDVPYEILEELNLTESDPFQMRAAFARTGNEAEIETRFPLPPGLSPADFFSSSSTDDCQPGCPSWPCCLSELLECEDDYIPDWCLDFDPECYPGAPNYPECLEEGESDDGPALNDCGCVLSSNPRFPGGCVRVQDSELGYRGVGGVKVRAYNGWFTTQSTYTTSGGGWRVDRSFNGRAWFWVKFKHEDGTRIRGARSGLAFWQHLFTIEDAVGSVDGPNFNNITISYDDWSVQGSRAHRYWSAASTSNNIKTYNAYARAENIDPLPELDVYIALNRNGGFALMTDYLNFGSLATIVTEGIANSTHFGDYPLFDLMIASTAGVTAESIRRFVPDVVIGTNTHFSDRLARLSFHELAHAGIFNRVGPNYWEKLAVAEIEAESETGDPWGNAASHNAGYISMMESWAQHVAYRFTHERYGTNISTTGSNNLDRLESTRNYSERHIPIGLYHDLDDTTAGESLSSDVDGPWVGYVNDQTGGILLRQAFSVIDDDVFSTEDFRQRILNDVLPGTGIDPEGVNALFDSYQ